MDRRHFLGLTGASLLGGCSTLQPSDDGGGSDQNGTAGDAGTGEESGIQAKIDLHTHLRRGGGQAMADRYAELGFDALIGTDHSNQVDPALPGEEDAERVEDYSDLEFPGPILNGIELSEDRHVNVIKSENEMVKQINHPMQYGLDAEGINEFADEIGADLVEITSDGEELDEYPTLTEAVEDLDPSPTITSDAHEPDAIGTGYVVVNVDELTGDAIVRALKEGDYSLGGPLLWRDES